MATIFEAMKSFFGTTGGAPRRAAGSARLGLEVLEHREVPAVISATVKTDAQGLKYLRIECDNTASRVTVSQAYVNTDQWSDTLVVKDDGNGFRKSVNVRTEKLDYVYFNGGDARDYLWTSMNMSLIAYGNGGDDFLFGTRRNDFIHGGDGNDYIDAGDNGNDKVFGDAGDDQLHSGHNIGAGAGYTYMEGGAGKDTFYNHGGQVSYRVGGIETPQRNLLVSCFRE